MLYDIYKATSFALNYSDIEDNSLLFYVKSRYTLLIYFYSSLTY